jgi:hypothetical protein
MFWLNDPFQLCRATPNLLRVDLIREVPKCFSKSYVRRSAVPILALVNKACASRKSLPTKLSTNLRLRVAIQVRTAIKGHVSSSVENSVGIIAKT